MSFENEQYEYIHEAYGSVELYAIYNVLICFVYTMPLPDTLIVYMRFYIFKIVFCHVFFLMYLGCSHWVS